MSRSDYIPDYTEQHAEYEARRERSLRRHPLCLRCRERIVADEFYNFDGDYVCEDCRDDYISVNFKVNTEEYMED